MRARAARAASRALRRLRGERRAVVLLYHRVVDVEHDPWSLCVTPQRFDEQLAVLAERARPTALPDLQGALEDGVDPRPPVAVTFDDGYADNLHNAAPTLERHGVPATFFLTSGQLGHEREFWWDQLERVLLGDHPLPPRLRTTVAGRRLDRELGDDRPPEAANGTWRAEDPPPGPREALYLELHGLLRPLPSGAREAALEELTAWSGADREARRSHRSLSPAEAGSLGETIEVGAHSVTHPMLSTLGPEDQRREMAESRAALEATVSRSVTSFAYPYGDHCERTLSIAAGLGFERACCAHTGAVSRRSERLCLPRLEARDWSGPELWGRVEVALRG